MKQYFPNHLGLKLADLKKMRDEYAKAYHPDKSRDPKEKEVNEARFKAMMEQYEIALRDLSNQNQNPKEKVSFASAKKVIKLILEFTENIYLSEYKDIVKLTIPKEDGLDIMFLNVILSDFFNNGLISIEENGENIEIKADKKSLVGSIFSTIPIIKLGHNIFKK